MDAATCGPLTEVMVAVGETLLLLTSCNDSRDRIWPELVGYFKVQKEARKRTMRMTWHPDERTEADGPRKPEEMEAADGTPGAQVDPQWLVRILVTYLALVTTAPCAKRSGCHPIVAAETARK
jgi:hypothetical protein